MQLNHVVVAQPGGNDTALVFDDIHSSDYIKANAYIQEKNPAIEQVMFVKTQGQLPCGLMAGGEFCGNATRALGYYLLKGKEGSIDLSISGAGHSLTVRVEAGSAQTAMPIIQDTNSVQELSDVVSLVKLEGITHLIFDTTSKQAQIMRRIKDRDEKKSFARRLLIEHRLQEEVAGGIMILDEIDGSLVLAPYVYVRAIDTFYAETACGSGSVAVALALAKRAGHSIHKKEIIQPSGQPIFVDVEFKEGRFERASIEGPVGIIYEGGF